MSKDNREYKTGRNFSSHDRNNPVDYKKVRRDVFNLVEQLTESNWILTSSLQHNENLHRKSLARIKEMNARIEELERICIEHDGTEFILRDKIKHQDDLINQLNNDICDAAEKNSPDCKKEVN